MKMINFKAEFSWSWTFLAAYLYVYIYVNFISAYINLYSYKHGNRDLCSPIICQCPIPSVVTYILIKICTLNIYFLGQLPYLLYYLFLEVNIGYLDFWALSSTICYMSNIIWYLSYHFYVVLDFNYKYNYSFVFKNSSWGLWNWWIKYWYPVILILYYND